MTVRGANAAVPQQRVLQSIANASQRTGVPFNYLLHQARTESSFNPAAKASSSSASGLFQFTNQTWLATLHSHGADHGLGWAASAIQRGANGSYSVTDPGLRQQILDLRFDPAAASTMAGEFASDNSNFLSQRLGREIDQTDLSIAHFLGAQGALKFLTAFAQDPNASAAPYFPEAASANRAVFYGADGAPRSFAEIRSRFAVPSSDPVGEAIEQASGPAVSPLQSSRQQISAQSSASARSWSDRMREIEPMPARLSLAFAQNAYRRLASIGDGQ